MIFSAAVAFVPLSILALYLSRNNTERYMLITEISFSAMTFSVIKRLTDVFSCTRVEAVSRVDGQRVRLCEQNIVSSCMDSVPSIECWEQEHYIHIMVAIGTLIP